MSVLQWLLCHNAVSPSLSIWVKPQASKPIKLRKWTVCQSHLNRRSILVLPTIIFERHLPERRMYPSSVARCWNKIKNRPTFPKSYQKIDHARFLFICHFSKWSKKFCYIQRILTIWGSVTVQLTSCLTSLDATKQEKLLIIQHQPNSWIQTK